MLSRLLLSSALAVLGVSLCATAGAAVYKYQDENGKWHFTDRPPAEAADSAVTTVTGGGEPRDFKQELEDRFKPASNVDRAMLSVVTVETAAGSGSGFFVTDDGYLVTNRHVVRPATSTQAREMEGDLAERKQQLERFEAQLKDEKLRLQEVRATIDEEREYAESGAASASYRAQYERYVERYARDKKRYDQEMARYRKYERDYKSARSEFGFNSSLTNFSRKFTVTLKDGRSASARLIRISKDHDLALLKVDNSTTPHLKLVTRGRPRQGTRVFAIGSPLGISDALTTGIVTKSGKDFLLTDTQILPGNSGGPLVDDQGAVLGVNTAVVTGGPVTNGLGLVIYARHIASEFARDLGGRL